MVDVLLTHSYHLYFDRKQVRKMKPYPPLGTLYAASLLRKYGFSVALFDTMLENPEEKFEEALQRYRPKIVAVYEDNFNFLSKMCLTRMREVAFGILNVCKTFPVVTLINGSDATDHQEQYLERGFDYVLIGEAEWTLLELTQQLLGQSAGHGEKIRGLAYWDPLSEKPIRTPLRPHMPNLDALPFPAWDLIDGEQYKELWRKNHGYFSLNMVSSRGCPYHCNWCAKPIYGTAYNVRSPEEVAGEMRFLKQLWEPDQLWFADDIFALRPAWTDRFAKAVRDFDAIIPFKIQSRVDLMTATTARQLADAGCFEIWMGAESGSQKILDAMEKGTSVDQISEACSNLKSAGIRPCLFLQLGFPGESWDDIQKTIDLVRRTKPDDIGVSVSYPLPGTKFFKEVKNQLGPKTNWDDSGDLAMMFKGTYTGEFYQALHDALHLEVELNKRIPMVPGNYCNFKGRSLNPAPYILGEDWLRLQELWERVAQCELRCRNSNPTLLNPVSEYGYASAFERVPAEAL
jgi:anaerobic magnesium-protoporphyrin IX monomethyl ester cyclase